MDTSAATSSLPPPILSLPDELLVKIFAETTRNPTKLMRLARVCRVWHAVVTSTSELWSHVRVKGASMRQLHSQLALSGTALLNVKIRYSGYLAGVWRPSRTMLIEDEWDSNIGRVKRFDVYGVTPSNNSGPSTLLVALLNGREWPVLEALKCLPEAVELDFKAPSLRSLAIKYCSVRDWSRLHLGSAFHYIDWHVQQDLGKPAMEGFMRAMAECPNLRGLKLSAARVDLDEVLHINNPEPLWPRMENLDIDGRTASYRDLAALFASAPHIQKCRIRLLQPPHEQVPPGPGHYRTSPLLPNLRQLNISVDTYRNISPFSDDRNLFQFMLSFYNLSALSHLSVTNIWIPLEPFSHACTNLHSLTIFNISLNPLIIASLAHCRAISEIIVRVSWENVDPIVLQNSGPAADTILPLSGLHKAYLNVEDYRNELSCESPVLRYATAVFTRLICRAKTSVQLVKALLMGTDISRLIGGIQWCDVDLMFRRDLESGHIAIGLYGEDADEEPYDDPSNGQPKRNRTTQSFAIDTADIVEAVDAIISRVNLTSQIRKVVFHDALLPQFRSLSSAKSIGQLLQHPAASSCDPSRLCSSYCLGEASVHISGE